MLTAFVVCAAPVTAQTTAPAGQASPAQATASTITGLVRDVSGGVIRGAEVVALPVTGAEARVLTGDDGRFTVTLDGTGVVVLLVHSPGFAEGRQTIEVGANRLDLEFALAPAGLEETVGVSAPMPKPPPPPPPPPPPKPPKPPAPPQGTERTWSGQADLAATLGHSSSASFGLEIDYRWKKNWDLAFEVGHIGNITTSDLQARATKILTDDAAVAAATGLPPAFPAGTTANTVQHAIYYDIGVRYHLMPDGTWNPYLAVGLGGSRLNTETTFSAPSAAPIGFGVDLDGYVTKAFFLLGAGVNHPMGEKYFLDGSLRLGRVFPRTGLIPGDTGVNTFRVQVGVGRRF